MLDLVLQAKVAKCTFYIISSGRQMYCADCCSLVGAVDCKRSNRSTCCRSGAAGVCCLGWAWRTCCLDWTGGSCCLGWTGGFCCLSWRGGSWCLVCIGGSCCLDTTCWTFRLGWAGETCCVGWTGGFCCKLDRWDSMSGLDRTVERLDRTGGTYCLGWTCESHCLQGCLGRCSGSTLAPIFSRWLSARTTTVLLQHEFVGDSDYKAGLHHIHHHWLHQM